MSDARLRDLERELAADPTPAARDRLAAERARRGDGPWLPVLAADLARWSEAIFREKVEMLFREWEATAAPGVEARGVPAFYSIREQMEAIDRAQRAAGLADEVARDRGMSLHASIRATDNARGTIRLRLEWASDEVTFGEDA